ncbi:HNH endonuclease family protein [Arthrobacter globiformis]|uniref:HNH endonuclease family protein n=1 Tax=Arthrobacter globiformis TaxID=1665 RepID=UPI00278DDF6E|nr:HNH endonuclease family protein [Arthrobacter globiformis]MDQ0617237.1 hypothetical protein [Arthrobacter globiformis]
MQPAPLPPSSWLPPPAAEPSAQPGSRRRTLSPAGQPATRPATLSKQPTSSPPSRSKDAAPKTGYDREEFGPAWQDTDHNGCDTRNDILARDLTKTTLKPGTNNCIVLTGSLADPYTATTIAFTRGSKTSSAVQIDHVVALSDAWQKGAQRLSKAQRTVFANDPLNLLAASGPANQQKSDGDAATWLPSSKAYRCPYVARQISVKAKYKLWVTQAERTAMAAVLAQCGGTVAGGK